MFTEIKKVPIVEERPFVARITKSLKAVPIETYENTHPAIIRDAKVNYNCSEKTIRLVEFSDKEDRLYIGNSKLSSV